MITLSASAVRQILAATQASDAQEQALRVAARRMPDGSLEYGLGFDEPREGDLTLEQDGVRLLVGAPSQPLLDGTTIDFAEYEPGAWGFLFVPSNFYRADDRNASTAGGGSPGGE
jgi:iron-sulfur cluster assembly protein